MSLSHRIRIAREHAGLTQKELADRVGISQTAVHKLECGRSRSSRRTVTIALTSGVNPVWLETGHGDMLATPSGAMEATAAGHLIGEDPGAFMSTPAARVPLIRWSEAGDWSREPELLNSSKIQEWVALTRRFTTRTFALRVTDDSMAEEFSQGDLVIIDPTREPEHNEYVVVSSLVGKMTSFKQLVMDGGRYFLKPLNPRYPITEIDMSQTHICGVVVAKYKEY
ncbi:MAG: helix-turn-helix domain-containing protein [Magnetococcus sp. WYHC-3]